MDAEQFATELLKRLTDFASGVSLWVDNLDRGLSTKDEFITDIRLEVDQLEFHLRRLVDACV